MKRIIIAAILLLPMNVIAGVTGKLAGKVVDATTGEPLVAANIQILGTNLGAASDLNGKFVILNIPPGVVTVRANYIGYEMQTIANVRINVDLTTTIEIKLKPATIDLEQEVVVVAERPLIQKDMTSTSAVIRRDEIEGLPVANFVEMLTLQAGVVNQEGSLHVRGGRSNEVAYMIDGMYVQDPLLGRMITQINNDAIQEMSLLSGTFNAEYGNALSGVVNIVTRDGGDQHSGSLEARTSQFGVDRYEKLGENRINGNIGGPLFTKKIKYFISGEKDDRDSYLPFGYDRSLTLFNKLSFSVFPNLKLVLSNRASKGKRQNYSHEYKYIPEQYLRSRRQSWQTVLSATHTLRPNLFYDLRASYLDQKYYSGVDKDTSEYLSTTQREYLSTAGNGYEFWQKADPLEIIDSRTRTADFKGDMVWQIEKINEVKLGLQYKKHWLKLFSIYDPKRNFPYINDYRIEPFEAAAYVQDKIEFPYLIINLGLRYDYFNANALFRKDPLNTSSPLIRVKSRSQLSPRIGIAHPVSEKTKLHFAYGHFFQNPEYQFLFENKQYDLNVREPLFGQPSLDAERTIAYEVGLSHQFSERIAAHLTAYYKDVTGLIGTRYYEAFMGNTGRYVGYTVYINEDYANIKGFEINVDVRPGKYFSGGLSYTFMIAKGSASSETEQYPGTQESTKLYYLNFDQRHNLSIDAMFRVPNNEGPSIFGLRLLQNTDYSIVLRASSGFPYTPTGRDIGFVDRNSLRMPGRYSIDLEIGKEFPLLYKVKGRAFVEILNLTDHRNILYVYGDTGEPDFTFVGGHSKEWMNDPSNFGPPRIIRLGMGLKF
ncbi:MAG: TonB-dependent receptor [candidate division KSB1 bacterium]|nr:TonB-dependent receptor [candidate division KSB1 bacterium]MDZ7336375.1 TonB-dependent receptor [candidate division KSB1 bacterium]MDZ7358735.1 TonB-dependent receptor [candidate division KSB1 bacterium]MDZ7376981.1 TonB-dependent receptor [candidate division KSB1 bacterium]MDZ7401982.1 TonB-dependent receptor [candidate division KSB1 bacterium]